MAIEDIPPKDDPSPFQEKSVNHSMNSKATFEELDRDYAEITMDIQFLEDQVRCELERYSPEALTAAKEKINGLKKKAETIQSELEKRKPSN